MLHLDALDQVSFKLHPTYQFRFGGNGTDQWLQVIDTALPPAEGSGRKWRLSDHMTRSEIVQTGFLALLAFVEHEARESFCYRGEPIFGPHFNIEALWCLAADREFDLR